MSVRQQGSLVTELPKSCALFDVLTVQECFSQAFQSAYRMYCTVMGCHALCGCFIKARFNSSTRSAPAGAKWAAAGAAVTWSRRSSGQSPALEACVNEGRRGQSIATSERNVSQASCRCAGPPGTSSRCQGCPSPWHHRLEKERRKRFRFQSKTKFTEAPMPSAAPIPILGAFAAHLAHRCIAPARLRPKICRGSPEGLGGLGCGHRSSSHHLGFSRCKGGHTKTTQLACPRRGARWTERRWPACPKTMRRISGPRRISCELNLA